MIPVGWCRFIYIYIMFWRNEKKKKKRCIYSKKRKRKVNVNRCLVRCCRAVSEGNWKYHSCCKILIFSSSFFHDYNNIFFYLAQPIFIFSWLFFNLCQHMSKCKTGGRHSKVCWTARKCHQFISLIQVGSVTELVLIYLSIESTRYPTLLGSVESSFENKTYI